MTKKNRKPLEKLESAEKLQTWLIDIQINQSSNCLQFLSLSHCCLSHSACHNGVQCRYLGKYHSATWNGINNLWMKFTEYVVSFLFPSSTPPHICSVSFPLPSCFPQSHLFWVKTSRIFLVTLHFVDWTWLLTSFSFLSSLLFPLFPLCPCSSPASLSSSYLWQKR